MSIDIIDVFMKTPRSTAKQETRSALIKAALQLFNEEGFDSPSLDAICAKAGFTRGAFYVHFKDRDDLVAAAMVESLQGLLKRVIDENPEAETSLLRTVVHYINETLLPRAAREEKSGPRFHQFLEACHRSSKVRGIFKETIGEAIRRIDVSVKSGQKHGGIREDIESDDISAVLVLMALGALVAVDVSLDMKLEETRNAALQLFQPPR